MENLQIISIWETKREVNRHINLHSHKYHELVYYPTGSGITKIDNETFSFNDNCFALIRRGTDHNETHHTSSDVICLEFTGTDNLPFGFFYDKSHMIHKNLKELLNEIREQKYGYKEMLTIKLNELLVRILRDDAGEDFVKDFAHIVNYIKENLHEDIKLSDCAKQLNISYDYFRHKFKTITGFSPQQYLIEQRLIASKRMLKDSNYTCTEIAYRCGFSTAASFSALFKTKYCITPLQFRKTTTEN